MNNRTQLQTLPTEADPYEWGVMYRNDKGDLQSEWGYAIDPRTTGVMDELSCMEINNVLRIVLVIGKRLPTSPPIWETPSGIQLTPSH